MEPQKHLSAESESIFKEGIGLVLSRWSALQIAVENEWGGRDSYRKADLLASEIFSWFTQSTGTLCIVPKQFSCHPTRLACIFSFLFQN